MTLAEVMEHGSHPAPETIQWLNQRLLIHWGAHSIQKHIKKVPELMFKTLQSTKEVLSDEDYENTIASGLCGIKKGEAMATGVEETNGLVIQLNMMNEYHQCNREKIWKMIRMVWVHVCSPEKVSRFQE